VAWLLRCQHPELFREVLLILRARARADERAQLLEELLSGSGRIGGTAPASPADPEEESAL